MIKNRLKVILTLFMIFTIALNVVNASSLVDTQRFNDVYKVSQDSSEFKVPFVRIAQGRIEVDKELSQDGIFVSQAGIEITKPVDGMQVYYSTDTVRINADSEYSAIISGGNVIISGVVEKTTMIYCLGEVTLDENANVKGNLLVYAPVLNINSKVDGNVVGVANKFNLNNEVAGQVRVRAEEVNVAENSKVGGEFSITTSNPNLNVEGATIDVINTQKNGGAKNFFITLLNTSIMDIVAYLIILIFMKKEKLAALSKKLDGGKRVLVNGLLSMVGIAISIFVGIALLLVLPKVGVASVIFGIAALIIFVLLKNIIVVTFITEMAIDKYEERQNKPNRIVTAIFSFIILNLLAKIPVVGSIVGIFVFILATGIVITLCTKNNKEDKKAEVVDAN